jgi:beta-lactamase class A
MPVVRRLLMTASALFAATSCQRDRLADFRLVLESTVAGSSAETVGFYFRDLGTGDSVLMSPDARVHAASMMKVPVMIQLFRDQEAGIRSLDDSTILTKTFRSIVDGSAYDLSAPDDGDTTLYRRIGQRESLRRLTELMITVSSNLATNILIELVGADRAQATMRELGADSIAVLRGVEDIKAYEAGLSNTTTARDLGVIFTAIAEHRAASPESSRDMIDILARQEFNEGIPAGLPPDVRVAHKTGSITEIRHDGGIVYLPNGRAYVLVVLTRGIANDDVADELIADLSRLVYEHVVETVDGPDED